MELDVTTLEAARLGDADRERALGWLRASDRGFHLPRSTSEQEEQTLAWMARDGAVLRGVWPTGVTTPGIGSPHVPVATLSSWTGELNTGSALLGLHQVSDVTVSPTHRRRGLGRRLVTGDLAAAHHAGLPLAGLTASEGGIYRRFGFGPATSSARYRVDVNARFALEEPPLAALEAPAGRLATVEPDEVLPVARDVFARWHASVRGSVRRQAAYEGAVTGVAGVEDHKPVEGLRGIVHLDADGRPDGYALYVHAGWDVSPLTVKLHDFVALGPDAHRGLWQFLGAMDLVERVEWDGPLGDPLPWALMDPRCVEVRGVSDHLWLRVLDVPTALAGRPWWAEGSLVLGVDDPLGYADGAWRLDVRAGRAQVARSREAPGVRMHVSTLGSLMLGGVDVPTLARAGRLVGAVEELAALADGGDLPYCATFF